MVLLLLVGVLACLYLPSTATVQNSTLHYTNSTQLASSTSSRTSSSSSLEGTTSSRISKSSTLSFSDSAPLSSISTPLHAQETSIESTAGLGSYILSGVGGGSPSQSSSHTLSAQSGSTSNSVTLSYISNTTDLHTSSGHAYTLPQNSTISPYLPSSLQASNSSETRYATSTGASNATASASDIGSTNTTGTLSTTRPAASGFYPFASGNITSAIATNPTSVANVSLDSTGSGSVYASRCNSELSAWSVSSYNAQHGANGSHSTTISYVTYTNWTAQTTTLGGCDTRARLVGSFTPIATGTVTSSYVDFGTPSIPPSPTCSINPSDCSVLRNSSLGNSQSFSNAQFRAQATLILAPSATALTIVSLNTVAESQVTTVTTFGTAAMTPPPVITWDGSTFPADVNGVTLGNDSYTVYQIDDWYGSHALRDGDSVVATSSVSLGNVASPQCSVSATDPGCGACTIYGGQVQLLYFPVSANASRDMCATTQGPATTCPLGPLTAPYTPATALSLIDFHGCTSTDYCPYLMGNTSTTDSGPYTVYAGTTLYANRAYLSLETAYAANQCGRVGAGHSGSLITLASSQVHSIHSYSNQCVEQGYSFNFADLLPNLPQSAWSAAAPLYGHCASVIDSVPQPVGARNYDVNNVDPVGDFVNGIQLSFGQPCGDTIIDSAYFPTLLVPTQVRGLDPAWVTCVAALEGLYDPPKSLTLQTTADAPSVPGVQTTTPASPASTRSPTQPTPTAVKSDAFTPSAQPAQSGNAASSDPVSSAATPQQTATDPAEGATSPLATTGSADPGNGGAAGSILSDALSPTTADASNPGGVIASVLGSSKTLINVTPTPGYSNSNEGGTGSTNDGSGPSSSGDPQSAASSDGTGSDPSEPGQTTSGGFGSTGNHGDSGSSTNDGLGSSPTADPQPESSSGTGSDSSEPGQSASGGSSSSEDGTTSGQGDGAGSTNDASGSPSPGDSQPGSSSGTGSDPSEPGQSSGGSSSSEGGSTSGQGGATSSDPGDPSDEGSLGNSGSSDPAAVEPSTVTAGSSAFTVAATTRSGGTSAIVVAAGGTTATLALGQTTSLSGEAISADSSGGVVIGSRSGAATVAPISLSDPSSGSRSNSDPSSGALIGLGSSSTLSVLQTVVTGSNDHTSTLAVIGSATITPGAATTLDGHTVSLGPSGLVVDGTTRAISALPAASSHSSSGAILDIGSSRLTASQTVVAGSNGQRTTEAVIGGSTLTQGGAAATIDGHTITLASNSLILDRSSTVSMSGFPAAAIAQISEGAVLTFGSNTLTAAETVVTGSNGQLSTEVVLDGTGLSQGGPAVTIDGHTVSLGSNGIIVDGSSTAQLSSLGAASVVEALITLGSATLTASQTLVTGVDGRTALEAIVDGSTLLAGASPVTISGHALSFGPAGIVVDGTQTDPFSTLVRTTQAPMTFTEHSQVFTATPVPGRPGVYVIDDQTVSLGGPQITVDGLAITAQPSDLIIDGTHTVSVISEQGGPAHSTAGSAPSVTVSPVSPTGSQSSAGDKSQTLKKAFLRFAIFSGILAVII